MTFPHLPRLSLLFSTLLLVTMACGAQAQETTEDHQSLANQYVHEILPYWQHRLALDDWDVHVLLSRPEDLRPGTLGNIHWDRDKKAATIRVMDSTGYHTDLAAMLKDMQVTVVHELVHLELASLPVAEADRSNQEFAIDHLTDALLASGSPSVVNPPALSR
ncbi:MAG TPA: hypothetical protein VGM43_02735 [Bryobacteraceae bacterium]